MKIIIADDYCDMSFQAAHAAAEFINENPGALLCFAAGDTPMGMFEELIATQKAGKVDLSSVYYAELDEWVGLGYDDRGSCRQVMFDAYYTPAGISNDRINIFDGLDPDTDSQCRKMEAWIAEHGGIALAVLGVGLNGHIGFNEPNTPDKKGCFTVMLDEVTTAVSIKYFDRPLAVEKGITIGWSTLKDSKKLILIASGEKKASIAAASLCGKIDSSVPASLLQNHGDLTAIIDKPAAKLLHSNN